MGFVKLRLCECDLRVAIQSQSMRFFGLSNFPLAKMRVLAVLSLSMVLAKS